MSPIADAPLGAPHGGRVGGGRPRHLLRHTQVPGYVRQGWLLVFVVGFIQPNGEHSKRFQVFSTWDYSVLVGNFGILVVLLEIFFMFTVLLIVVLNF